MMLITFIVFAQASRFLLLFEFLVFPEFRKKLFSLNVYHLYWARNTSCGESSGTILVAKQDPDAVASETRTQCSMDKRTSREQSAARPHRRNEETLRSIDFGRTMHFIRSALLNTKVCCWYRAVVCFARAYSSAQRGSGLQNHTHTKRKRCPSR
eukprot:2362215-Prymnesium_polylepis.1